MSRNVLNCLIKFLRRPGVPPARTSGLFWADHGLLLPNPVREALPTNRKHPSLGTHDAQAAGLFYQPENQSRVRRIGIGYNTRAAALPYGISRGSIGN